MKNQIFSSRKKRNTIIFSVLGGLTVIGLVAFGEESPHYATYSNVQETYGYYNDGWSALISDANENNNQTSLEVNEQSFQTFISSYQSEGYQNYQTFVKNSIDELNTAAENYYTNVKNEDDTTTKLTDFQSSYITPANSKLQVISRTYVPRIYGFVIGVIVFILSLGVMLSFYFTRNSLIKPKKPKPRSNKI